MNSFRLKSYFTFLSRNKLFTAINLFGFAISLMVVVLLGLYLKGELSVDTFHQKKDRIYRLERDKGGSFASPIAADIKNRYPEIEAVTRVGTRFNVTLKIGEEKILVNPTCVDSTFFTMFSYPFVEGDPARQLQTVNEVVLTKSFATKLFGKESALGKTIAYDTIQLTVCGVAEDFNNTHFEIPDMVMRFEHVGPWYLDNYDSCNWALYVLTTPGSDLHAKLPDMVEYFKGYFWMFQNGVAKEVKLRPIEECYFGDDGVGMVRMKVNSRTFIRVLELAALLILLFAVINYINLSVAQSGFRAREAATRRLLGSSRAGLFAGFIWESVLFCAGAFVAAVLLAIAIEPSFNKLMESKVEVVDALTSGNLLLTIVAIALLGFIAGLIPALVISRHTPIEVVRGSLTRKTKMMYSRIFIVFQYCITIVLLGCTLTIMRQTSFMRTTDLGFNKANIIYMDNTLGKAKRPGFRDKLMQIKGVESVSYTAGTPIDGGNNQTVSYDDRDPIGFQAFEVDSAFMPMLGIEILRRTGVTDKKAAWLNETAVKELNLSDSATTFKMYEQMMLAGVVKDFHFRDLSKKIGPAVIFNHPGPSGGGIWTILVKISGANQAETFREVKEAHLEYNGGIPFDSGFIDEEINRKYDRQERTYTIIGSFALIAIVIAALGMLAMATYYMRQRTKEIAIRKVFGSTSGEVFWRVILNFIRMVAIAFVLAVPVVWYAMDKWLTTYAYRIPLSWTIFAIAGGIAFAIAFIAVAYQSYRATSANPVDSLHR